MGDHSTNIKIGAHFLNHNIIIGDIHEEVLIQSSFNERKKIKQIYDKCLEIYHIVYELYVKFNKDTQQSL